VGKEGVITTEDILITAPVTTELPGRRALGEDKVRV
jgi:hypothetical protein